MKRVVLYLALGALFIGFNGCKRKGCIDPTATNYDTKAKKDDGTCEYPPAINNFGEITTAVVIVNPVVNTGSSTTITSGTQRENVGIKAGNLAEVKTDATGLAIIENIPVGKIPFTFSSGSVDVDIIQEKELYDVVVSYDASGVQEFIQEIRYPIGGTVIFLNPGDDISAAANENNAIIFLSEGTFTQDVQITGDGVLIFGAWSPTEGPKTIIDGTLNVQGGNTRARGIVLTGNLIAKANGFSSAFCTYKNADISGDDVSLIRNKFTGSSVSVPSSNAVLLDNDGI